MDGCIYCGGTGYEDYPSNTVPCKFHSGQMNILLVSAKVTTFLDTMMKVFTNSEERDAEFLKMRVAIALKELQGSINRIIEDSQDHRGRS